MCINGVECSTQKGGTSPPVAIQLYLKQEDLFNWLTIALNDGKFW